MAENGLKALSELMGLNFRIPHYQRGYRWEEQEVQELLDDLWNFQKDRDNGDFYCLQPIVLQKNKDGSYDVLDGQQRLTTLYLILEYLEDRRIEDGYSHPLFNLNYSTRQKSEFFLSEKIFSNKELDSSNIDFYHICKAYECIDKWFNDEKHPAAKSKLVPVLLDKTEKGNRNIKFIWYEVVDEKNPINVFIRLNVGKIPLTDAELTKALLLQSDKYPSEELDFNKMRLHNIATEWDMIETTLQEKAFWFFLNDNSNAKSSHIEFIFDLLANKINLGKKFFWDKETNSPKMPNKHPTFLVLSEYLQYLIDKDNLSRIQTVEKIWSLVIEYFEYFNEWFNNRTLYHYIGFLIATRGNKIIDSLIRESKNLSKTEFIEYLEKEIAKVVKVNKLIKELVFEDEKGKMKDYKSILRILLLHNIHTTLKSENEKPRFPFELYKGTGWSIEHIYARNSQSIKDIEKQKSWLQDHIKSLSKSNNEGLYTGLLNRMNEMSKQNDINILDFEKIEEDLYETTAKYFEFGNDENVHLMNNLCLLDKATNSQLNNSVFDVKREKIKLRELSGYYIPICTRNVFLKAYTAYPSTNAYWTKNDRSFYLEDIESTYNFYVNK